MIKKNQKIKAKKKFLEILTLASLKFVNSPRIARDSNIQILAITLREEFLKNFFDASFTLWLKIFLSRRALNFIGLMKMAEDEMSGMER